MPKVWLRIKHNEGGFSPVEVLLAATVFGFLVTALIGAFIYGRQSTDNAGDRSRAYMLAEEGVEVVRNIKDAAYANLTDGTYGLAQTSNTWALSGSSDTTDIYTRQVTIAANGSNRKLVTSRVTWPQGTSTVSVDVVTQLTNWVAALVKSWTTPTLSGGYDSSGTGDAIKVATQGNYAYFIRTSGTPNFFILNISTPTAPTLVGSMTLAGTPTNIAVNGNYAYVSNRADTTELQVVNVTNPASPSLSGSYNASGTGDGLGVYYSNGYAYLSRAANGGNDELVIVNVGTPTAPSRTYGIANNVSMNEVYVYANNIYVVTNSSAAEVMEFTPTLFGLIYTTATYNLPGTTAATTITGYNNLVFVGAGTSMYVLNGSTGVLGTVLGSLLGALLGGGATPSTLTLPGTVNDLTLNATDGYVYAGTSFATGEFQVINVNDLGNMTVAGSMDIPGTSSNLTGVAYNPTLNSVPGASASDTREAVVFVPN